MSRQRLLARRLNTILDGISTPAARRAADTFGWLLAERDHQLRKFTTEGDDAHTADGLDWWDRQLDNYRHRATVLGLDTPGGRQALAKFAATACAMLESVSRVHGPPPDAGVPSGTACHPPRHPRCLP